MLLTFAKSACYGRENFTNAEAVEAMKRLAGEALSPKRNASAVHR
jgi:hypothetical protein